MSTRTFILAGGCFWCLDAFYRTVRGVVSVRSGYIGGSGEDASYGPVCTGSTGHAEAVEVVFDEQVIDADTVLDMFFAMHNPTTPNRQNYDVGTQYRSAMFASSPQECALFERAIARAQELWADPIVTSIEPGPGAQPSPGAAAEESTLFFEAERIHQDYYANNPEAGYCQVIIDPKLSRARSRFASWIQS